MESNSLINKIILDIKNELAKVELKIDNIDKITKFIEEINKDIFNRDLLESFFDSLELSESINDFEDAFNCRKDLQGNVWFLPQFEKVDLLVNKLVKACESKLHFLNGRMGHLHFKVSLYSNIIHMLEDKEVILSKEDIDNIFEVVGFTLSEEERFEFLVYLVKNNAVNIELNINSYIKKREDIIIEKKKQQSKKTRRQLIKKRQEVESVQDEIDIEVKEEQVDEVLIEAQKISLKHENEELYNSDFVVSALELLKEDISIDERIKFYDGIKNYEIKLILIARDLKENILSKYDNDKSLNLEDIINVYNKTEEEYFLVLDKATSLDYSELLSELDKSDELKNCKEIEEFIIYLNNLLYKKHYLNQLSLDNDTYIKLDSFLRNLTELLGDFKEIVADYYAARDDSKLCLFNEMYELLINTYLETKDVLQDTIDNTDEIDLKTDFYENKDDVKNIIIVMNDKEHGVDVITDDFNNYDNLSYSNLPQLLKRLKKLVYEDLSFSSDKADHKVKTPNYGIDFQKKYGIKSKHCGDLRIFYSKFRTTLSQIMPEFKDNVNIVIIHSVGYGSVSDIRKAFINEKAFYRCYSYREEVDNIIELFTTNWNDPKLSREERIRKQNKIISILESGNNTLKKLAEGLGGDGKKISGSGDQDAK